MICLVQVIAATTVRRRADPILYPIYAHAIRVSFLLPMMRGGHVSQVLGEGSYPMRVRASSLTVASNNGQGQLSQVQ